jgi:hypothetical protein
MVCILGCVLLRKPCSALRNATLRTKIALAREIVDRPDRTAFVPAVAVRVLIHAIATAGDTKAATDPSQSLR